MDFKYSRTATPHFIIQKLIEYEVNVSGADIFEFGSTDLATVDNPSPEELDGFFDFYGIKNKSELADKFARDGRLRMKHVWQSLGARTVDGADGDGFECTALDFNRSVKEHFDGQYDIVLNLGTTEHVFNIARAFSDTHDLCKKNGVILYALPTKGYLNHGYYTVSPKLLFDIAKFNCYEILGSFKQLVVSEHRQEFIESELPTEDFYYDNKVWDEENIAVFVFLKKLCERPFREPYECISSNFASESVIGAYMHNDADCFLAKNKISKNTKVAIFGARRAAQIAYDFCLAHNVGVGVVIDDFATGEFNGIKIISRNIFRDEYSKEIKHILYGEGQSSVGEFEPDVKIVCIFP